MSSPTMVGTLTNQQANASEHLVRDVSSVLAKYEPDIFPLDTLLRQTEMIGKGKSQKHEWASVTSWARKDLANGASGAGSPAGAVKIVVDNGGYWRVNDIIYLPSQAKLDSTVPNLIVTAVNPDGDNTNELTVYALAGGGTTFGTVPAIADNEVLAWIGNAKGEGAAASASRGQAPGYEYNYMQILDTVVDITGSREAVKNFTNVQDWERMQKEQIGEFRKSLEATLWFSKRGYSADAVTGNRRYTMGGVESFVTESATYEIGNGLTESIIMDMLRQSFSGNNGSSTRIMFADSYLSMAIQKSQLSKLQSLTNVTIAGIKCGKMVFNEGTVLLKHHRMFNELGMDHFGYLLDPKNIKKQELRTMEKNDIDYKKQGYDKKGIWLLEESTIEVTNPAAHLKIYGV